MKQPSKRKRTSSISQEENSTKKIKLPEEGKITKNKKENGETKPDQDQEKESSKSSNNKNVFVEEVVVVKQLEANKNKKEKEILKQINERVTELFQSFQEEHTQQNALKELRKACKHAGKNRKNYEKNEGEGRNNIEQYSILFKYLTLSPECAEVMKLWEIAFNSHNKKILPQVMELLAKIIKNNYFLTTKKTNIFLSRNIVKDKLKWVYAAFSSASTPNGKFISGLDNALLVRSALQLLTACSNCSPTISLYLNQHFNFTFKPFTQLVNRRSKKLSSEKEKILFSEKLFKQDIRTQFVKFVLSFLHSPGFYFSFFIFQLIFLFFFFCFICLEFILFVSILQSCKFINYFFFDLIIFICSIKNYFNQFKVNISTYSFSLLLSFYSISSHESNFICYFFFLLFIKNI